MNRYITWFLIFLAIFVVLYLSKDILMPFIAAMIISYILSPLAKKMESKLGIKKVFVAAFLILILIIIFFSFWILIIPLIYDQITSFVENVPRYKEFFYKSIMPEILTIVKYINADYVAKVHEEIGYIVQLVFEAMVSSIHNIWKSGFMFFGFFSMIILVPLISFHLIKDWDKMVENIIKLVPHKKKDVIRNLLKEMDNAVSGFFRGQLNVCVILSIYYSIAFLFIGLKFGIFIGIATGALAFIPFLGFLSGFLSSLVVAYFQFKSWYGIFMVIVVFVVGNILDSIISPKIIGHKIGLHPVWIIFFVLLGASLFGVVGMLFAIPSAAIISILVKFFIKNYYRSTLYKT